MALLKQESIKNIHPGILYDRFKLLNLQSKVYASSAATMD